MLKTTGIVAAMTLALLVTLEGAASSALVVYRLIWPAGHPNAAYAQLPMYRRDPNGAAYWAEFDRAAAVHYVDGLGWQREDFHGTYITVVAGHRLSRTRGETDLSVYGGSTVWGTGVEDGATLAALLRARNFGEGAYVSAQNLLQFEKEVVYERSSGNPAHGSSDHNHADPVRAAVRVALFYEGVNDAYASCINPGIDGATLMYARMKQKVEYRQGSDLRLADLAGLFVHHRSPAHYRCESRSLAEHAALTMVRTWKQAQDLGDLHGVRTVFILQPNAYVGKPDVGYLTLDQAVGPSLRNVYAEVGKAVHEMNIREYHDLSRVLDGAREVFIDYAHVTAEGNAVIANAIEGVL